VTKTVKHNNDNIKIIYVIRKSRINTITSSRMADVNTMFVSVTGSLRYITYY